MHKLHELVAKKIVKNGANTLSFFVKIITMQA